MRHMIATHSTNPTPGVIWRRSGGLPARREGRTSARRDLVVRDARNRAPPSRRALSRRCDPPASAGTCCSMHDDCSRARQRSDPRGRGRARPASFGRQSGLGGECFSGRPGVSARPVERRPHAGSMCCTGSRSGLFRLNPRPRRASDVTLESSSAVRLLQRRSTSSCPGYFKLSEQVRG